MAGYKATIAGMKPVILRGSSKPKALETMVTIESLTGEQILDELAAGVTIYDSGKPLTPIDPPAPAAAPEQRVNVESGMIEKRDPGQAGLAAGYRDDRPATLAELTEADPGATFRVDPKGGMVQRQPQGTDQWEDVREASPDEVADAKKK